MSSKTEDEQPTDEEVAREVQQGQRERFGVLVERYQEKLLRYGRRMLFNGRDIEDVVQEIFLKVYFIEKFPHLFFAHNYIRLFFAIMFS